MANPMHGLMYPSAKHSSAVFCATALAATSVKPTKHALIDSMVIEREARYENVLCARARQNHSLGYIEMKAASNVQESSKKTFVDDLTLSLIHI